MEVLKKGSKIKCIDDHFGDSHGSPFKVSDISLPKNDEIYTVREVVDMKCALGVLLEEIQNEFQTST